jgi:hypothetical protein
MTEHKINIIIYKALKINSIVSIFLIIYYYLINLLSSLFQIMLILNHPFSGGIYNLSAEYINFLMLFNLLIICGVTIYISKRYVKLLYLFLVITFFRVVMPVIITSSEVYSYYITQPILPKLNILISFLFEIGFFICIYFTSNKNINQETKKMV